MLPSLEPPTLAIAMHVRMRIPAYSFGFVVRTTFRLTYNMRLRASTDTENYLYRWDLQALVDGTTSQSASAEINANPAALERPSSGTSSRCVRDVNVCEHRI